MKTMQVFDSCEYQNHMPHQFGEEETTILIAGNEGAGNDTYHRWYPKRAEEWAEDGQTSKAEAARLFNAWLVDQGMVIDWEDEYFHVLIFINW